MDPIMTLCNALDALNTDDRSECIYLLACYFEWRVNGGFQPNVTLEDGSYWKGDRLAKSIKESLENHRHISIVAWD
jgi:hypothetical protein